MVRRNLNPQVSRVSLQGIEKCPFCGSETVVIDENTRATCFLCSGCGALVSFVGAEELDKAKDCWNRRSQDHGEARDPERV